MQSRLKTRKRSFSQLPLLLLPFCLSFIALSSQSDPYQATPSSSDNNSRDHLQFKMDPSLFLDFPVTKKDFQNWQAVGAAVILKNKAVLAPEVKDKKGIIYTKHKNQEFKRSWLLDVEIEMGNEKETQRGGTGVGLFYLKNVDRVSHKESIFGYSNRFEGMGIYLNTIMKGETRGKNREFVNAIQGYSNDGTRPINVFTEKKHICWKHFRNLPQGQNFKMRLLYDQGLVTLQVYDIYTQMYEFCFSFEANLDFNGYFLLSGSSGVHNPDHIYLYSFKLYDPKSPATNEHFFEARRAKLQFETEQLKNKVQEGVKDLFEKHSQADIRGSGSNQTRDSKQFFQLVPAQHNQLQHVLKGVLSDHELGTNRFFDTLKGLPSYDIYKQMNDKLFSFRLVLDKLNQAIDKEGSNLRNFERTLKQARYSANIQKGLQRREVNNQDTDQLHADLIDLDQKLQLITVSMQDYQQAMDMLSAKIRLEAGFTSKLEEERKRFAQEQSEQMNYDMTDIDEIFNEMELQVVGSSSNFGIGGGLSTMMVNLGMIIVIIFSLALWFKMNKHEQKNA